MAVWQTRLWLAQDRLAAASQWALERALMADGQTKPPPALDYFALIEYVALARVLMAQGKAEEATSLLQPLLETAEAGGRTTRVIEILGLQALAYQAGGHTDRAMASLQRALTLAEPEGFVRTFVDEGPPMARLLYEALSSGIVPDYVHELLAAFSDAALEQTDTAKRNAPMPDLIEPLSDRELQVLQLIAEGLTNPEIASRLYLATNTVKAHTRNIYGKLGVHNRTQAVARARSLGLLSST
jgi:LuxR family maltose regulon positive regulatory protein